MAPKFYHVTKNRRSSLSWRMKHTSLLLIV